MLRDLGFEWIIDRQTTRPVQSDEYRVPAPGPTERCRRTLYLRMAFSHLRVIALAHGALLGAEGSRCALSHIFDAFGFCATLSGERIADGDDRRVAQHKMKERVRGNVARGAIANAIMSHEFSARVRTGAVL